MDILVASAYSLLVAGDLCYPRIGNTLAPLAAELLGVMQLAHPLVPAAPRALYMSAVATLSHVICVCAMTGLLLLLIGDDAHRRGVIRRLGVLAGVGVVAGMGALVGGLPILHP